MLKKILIVDDDPTQCHAFREIIRVKMSALGAQADCLDTLAKARARLLVNNISLILLDLCFNLDEECDPYKTIPFIREAAAAGIPIIVTTGSDIFGSDILSECIAAGAADYFVKGSPAEELIQKIGFLLQKHYPETHAARVTVAAHRAAPKKVWEFPLSENFGAKLAVLMSFLSLLVMLWGGFVWGWGGIKRQVINQQTAVQTLLEASETAKRVKQHDQEFTLIKESARAIKETNQTILETLRQHGKILSELHDDVLRGTEQRKAITDRLDRMDALHK